MLSGKRFRLERATLSVTANQGKRTAVTVPAGAVVEILCESGHDDGLVEVAWEGRKLWMFLVDVDVRGTEIIEQSANA